MLSENVGMKCRKDKKDTKNSHVVVFFQMISEEILHVLQLKQTLHYQITEINMI